MKLIFLMFLIPAISWAQVEIKLAALAPEGTNWANTLKDMARDVARDTQGRVKFKLYYGGVAGDEPDVLRKIRIGQFHAGVFTGKILGEIYSDIRVIELPFNFYGDEIKAGKAIDSLSKKFEAGFLAKGFMDLGHYKVGNVYVVSTKSIKSMQDMKGNKIWAWEGDPLIKVMIESLGLISVPLALPDVMASLSTGIIDSAYAPPIGIIALQWQSKVKYLVNFPTAFSIGALLVDQKVWKRMSISDQGVVKKWSNFYIEKSNEYAAQDNKLGLAQLKKNGIEFLDFKKEELAKAESVRTEVINKLKGKFLSAPMIEALNKLR